MFSVVSQTIAATPSLLSIRMAYHNPKTGLNWRGRIAEIDKLASEAYRAFGASHEISPIVGHQAFDPHPFTWDTTTPPGGLRTQKMYHFFLFQERFFCFPAGCMLVLLFSLVLCRSMLAQNAPVMMTESPNSSGRAPATKASQVHPQDSVQRKDSTKEPQLREYKTPSKRNRKIAAF